MLTFQEFCSNLAIFRGRGRDGGHPITRIPIDRLTACGHEEIPYNAPPGYFWKRDHAGPLWRLYRAPFHSLNRKDVTRIDRVVVRYSAWGYVKPTYHTPDDIRREKETYQ